MTYRIGINLFIIITVLLFSAGRIESEIILEPASYCVGARTAGMGRVFTAASGEADSIFLNPAGLADLPGGGVTLTYAKLLNQANCLMIGSTSKLGSGFFGFGALVTQIGGPPNVRRDPNTGRLSLDPGGTITEFYNNTFYLALGRRFFPHLSAGLNIKMLNKGFLNGPDSGKGFSAGAGLLYELNDKITVGFVQRDFLASLGSKIQWGSGVNESIPNASRLGANYHDRNINLGADYEFYPTSARISHLTLGGEWWPVPRAAVRLGLGQSETSLTDVSAGFSFLFSNWKLDYACNWFSSGTNVTFSLSSGSFWTESGQIKPSPTIRSEPADTAIVEREVITISTPEDRSIILDNSVMMKGSLPAEARDVRVNGDKISADNNIFTAGFPLNPGKNAFAITAYDTKGNLLDEKTIRILRLEKFDDVPENYWAGMPISILATLKIVSGYPDGKFKPEEHLTRREIFALLTRLSTTSDRFLTLSPDEPLSAPNEPATRAEAVAAITRFAKIPPAQANSPPFPDIPQNYWAFSQISAAREAGLLNYLEGKPFDPERKVTRAEISRILSKLDPIGRRLGELLDFEKGY